MAQQHVTFANVSVELTNNTGKKSGIVVEVNGPNGKLGTIELGRGSFRWFKKGAHKGRESKSEPTFERTWTQFAKFMDENAD